MPHGKFLAEEKARKILNPHLPKLADCFKSAWQKWDRLAEVAPDLRYPLSARTRAGFIYDHICNEVRHQFEGVPGVTLVDSVGFLILTIENSLILRFKKLNKRDQSSNISTAQQERYIQQEPLPGLPEGTRLTAGYILDKIQAQIDDIRVTFPVGKRAKDILWSFSILGTGIDVMQPQLALDFEEPVRAKIKVKGLTEDTSTSDSKEANGQ